MDCCLGELEHCFEVSRPHYKDSEFALSVLFVVVAVAVAAVVVAFAGPGFAQESSTLPELQPVQDYIVPECYSCPV